jgi:hypothetical protein
MSEQRENASDTRRRHVPAPVLTTTIPEAGKPARCRKATGEVSSLPAVANLSMWSSIHRGDERG